jgi:ribosomal protein S12 methylthiotransferase accessory factor
MNPTPPPVTYAMTLISTEASTGFFAALPDPAPDLEKALAYLQGHPLDTFMHRYVLGLLGRLPFEAFQAFLNGVDGSTPLRLALVREAAHEHTHLSTPNIAAEASTVIQEAEVTPLVTLRALSRPEQESHRNWNRLLADNLNYHRLLPDPDKAPRPFPYAPDAVTDPGGVYITQIPPLPDAPAAAVPKPSADETAGIALEKLKTLDLLDGSEMRHEASLSPYGLLHKWRLKVAVDCGRHHYRLSGLQTAYGRGLTLANARASYAMEIVERCSSFATIGRDRVPGYLQEHRIHRGTRSALCKGALEPIDPNAFGVDAAYQDELLHWIEGIRRTPSGDQPVLVPVQCIFLFSNLDEVDLYSGHGSTGLASGNTMDEARLSALMELVERDGEATHPFHHSLCFQVESRDPQVAALLEDYRGRGIQFQFQDISPPYGIPCCKCFVADMDGRVCKGTAASLNGRRAVLSALTETPYPYPYGPPSGPGLLQLPQLCFEELPDYSTRDAATDLCLVESLLAANGVEPIYVDLTRKDIGLPVVRALLPGFALSADLEEAWRVHPRLFGNYLKLYGGQ